LTCTNCGTPIPDGANFCPKCGTLVDTPAAAALPKRGMPRWLVVMLIIGAALVASIPVLAIVAAIAIPNVLHARAQSWLAVDEHNLTTIAAAVEQYAIDHNGAYPDNLLQLVPKYIAKLPSVPGSDEAGAYDYHHPASTQPDAKYEIWDDGSMDPTTLRALPRGTGGEPCASDCKYVVYVAGAGLVGVPGQR
jgi:hypothetical protein